MRAVLAFRVAFVSALVAASTLTDAGAFRTHAQGGARERTLFVSALDASGEPVEGLGPADFVVTEDGRRREVLRVSRATEPIDVALLVDNSAASARAIPSLREALAGFVAKLAGDNQIALIALADRPTIFVDYTSNRMRLEQGIGRLFAMDGSGMTLLDAIVEVSAGLRRREASRAAIVPVVTAGIEFTNHYARDVIASVNDSGAGLHAIVVGELPIEKDVDRERALVLSEGTRRSGGQFVTLLAETGLERALERLARELSLQYKVVYGRPESLIPPDKIQVTSGRAGVTMRGTPARGQTGA